MIKDSVILRAANRLIYLSGSSALSRTFARLFAFLQRVCAHSWFLRPFRQKTVLSVSAEQSFFGLFLGIFRMLPLYFKGKLRKSITKSEILGRMQPLFHNSGLIAGMVLLLLVCVPNNKWNNAYNTILALFLLAFALLRALYLRRPIVKKGVFPLSLTAFIIVVCIAQVFSHDFALTLRFFIFYMTAFVFCLAMLSLADSARAVKQTVTLWLVGVFFSGVYGVWQNMTGAVAADPTLTDLSVSGDMPGRIYATFGNPNNYAELLILTIPLFFAMVLLSKKYPAKLFFVLTMLPPAAAMLFTGSRSGWVSLIFAVALFLIAARPGWLPFFAIAGVCALPLMPDFFMSRLLSLVQGTDSSSRYRKTIFETVAPLFHRAWFEGVGVGPQIFVNTTLNFPIHTFNPPPHVHRTIYQVFMEFGVFGFISLLCTVFGTAALAIRRIIAYFKRPYAVLLAGFGASIAGICLMSMGEHVWFYPRMMVCFFASFGLFLALIHIKPEEFDK